jgi:hypothetical protein
MTDQGVKKLPIATGSVTLGSGTYPAKAGGYTPGDTWDLYVYEDNRMEGKLLHVFHKNVAVKPVGSVKWIDAQQTADSVFLRAFGGR